MKQESSVSSYDAFISYRHTDLDLDAAEKLHRLLESGDRMNAALVALEPLPPARSRTALT